jgi:hypothetical protein
MGKEDAVSFKEFPTKFTPFDKLRIRIHGDHNGLS